MDWQRTKVTNSFSENVFLVYFNELAGKYKSSTLWARYSMLKSTLNINNGINIETHPKLLAFLKRKPENYDPEKAKTLTPAQIKLFLNEAPDHNYLVTKVALILEISGACRAKELYSLTTENFKDLGTAVLVSVLNTKNKVNRKFTIRGAFYETYRKYAKLRPTNANTDTFFLNYQSGKCTVQRIGINKFGTMGKQIATYLKLPNPELYTGHCFRRSSATLLVDAGGDKKARWVAIYSCCRILYRRIFTK
ncbi:hypothetical protein RI129_000133 [Pyrocoelia pectoralis]|uniref:Tyr recombinase domain-containing protein n=1 Tax=Pyrocoelia pectoralis TaxID=417401 RepID=A0AAN7USL0_9COLE